MFSSSVVSAAGRTHFIVKQPPQSTWNESGILRTLLRTAPGAQLHFLIDLKIGPA